MYRVALTGNIASGKSAVADIWHRLGARIIDADVLARRAVEPGSAGLRRIAQQFGAAVIRDGELDRAAVRRIVFADDEQRAALESIVHPEVERLRREEEARAEAAGERVIVHVIPLLFEAGLEDRFDAVVLVDADESARRERIIRTRGLGRDEAEAMIRAQMPAADKRALADYIIDNNAGLEELEEAAAQTWKQILAGAG
ncbi:MAG TPA: dephospho-CoA kinase [Longimicrobiales bacterium]